MELNQMQLEVQINEQYDDINSPTSVELPPAEPYEAPTGLVAEKSDSPPIEPPKHPCLPFCAFLAILFAFLWPFILILINYYTDWNLWQFINATHDNYIDAYDQITASNTNISILTCTIDGNNSLSEFESFLLN